MPMTTRWKQAEVTPSQLNLRPPTVPGATSATTQPCAAQGPLLDQASLPS